MDFTVIVLHRKKIDRITIRRTHALHFLILKHVDNLIMEIDIDARNKMLHRALVACSMYKTRQYVWQHGRMYPCYIATMWNHKTCVDLMRVANSGHEQYRYPE